MKHYSEIIQDSRLKIKNSQSSILNLQFLIDL